MKSFLLVILLLVSQFVIAQQVVIKTKNYTSYFDTILKQPISVVYKLYNGGGPCSRAKFRFINDTKYPTATDADYAKSGYDKGHLANSEDFAYDCELDELTFRYYNALPQTTALNRGIWKQIEATIRDLSKTDTLTIICYATDFVKVNKLSVPQYCYKIVYKQNKFYKAYQFTQKGEMKEVPETFFKGKLSFIK
jgi:endonuclease G